ncbi:MAG: Fic family protein [DPANN group archaeon]|nr:Fic family protein [DPANN group archaeon]
MAYLEQKTISGRKYYFLAENVRIGLEKWKKVRIYLGPASLNLIELEVKKLAALPKLHERIKYIINALPKKQPRVLTEIQTDTLEKIKKGYQAHLKKLAPEDLEKLEETILTDFTYNTNSIEGSTLSAREVGLILYENRVPRGKDLREIYGAANMKKAYDYIKSLKKLSEKRVKELHRIVMQDILSRELGKFRTVPVFIRGSKTVPPKPEFVQQQMRALLNWYGKRKDKLHTFELACKFHVEFEKIHPFRDGNGRTGRLLMNFILIKSSFPILDIKFKTRSKYFAALEHAQLTGDLKPFINYSFGAYVTDASKFGWLGD